MLCMFHFSDSCVFNPYVNITYVCIILLSKLILLIEEPV